MYRRQERPVARSHHPSLMQPDFPQRNYQMTAVKPMRQAPNRMQRVSTTPMAMQKYSQPVRNPVTFGQKEVFHQSQY